MAEKIRREKAVKTDFKYSDENEEWIEAKSYTISDNEFDENGNLSKERTFNSAGEFHEFNDYNYDEKGFLVEKIIYLDEDEIAERDIYYNDETGKPVKKTTVYQESSEDYTEYIYNEAGKLIEKVRKDDDGYIEEKEIAEYNGELLVTEMSYGLDNELIQKNTYSYDGKGNNVSTSYDDYLDGEKSRVENVFNESGYKEKILTYNSENQLIAKSLFEYDEKNRISEIIEEDRKSYKKTKLTYNNSDNVILQEEFDHEDNLILSIERTYSETGNIVKSAVFIEATGENVAQYYEVDYSYEYYDS